MHARINAYAQWCVRAGVSFVGSCESWRVICWILVADGTGYTDMGQEIFEDEPNEEEEDKAGEQCSGFPFSSLSALCANAGNILMGTPHDVLVFCFCVHEHAGDGDNVTRHYVQQGEASWQGGVVYLLHVVIVG